MNDLTALAVATLAFSPPAELVEAVAVTFGLVGFGALLTVLIQALLGD